MKLSSNFNFDNTLEYQKKVGNLNSSINEIQKYNPIFIMFLTLFYKVVNSLFRDFGGKIWERQNDRRSISVLHFWSSV